MDSPETEHEVDDLVEDTLGAMIDDAEKPFALRPRSLPGLVAQLRYLSGLEDWEKPTRFNDDHEDMQELCATMADALESIIGRGA
jgi:hypothetical protein